MRLLFLCFVLSLGSQVAAAVEFKTDSTFYSATGMISGRRIYLIHGFKADQSQWTMGIFKKFLDKLRAQGDEVVTFSVPNSDPAYFSGDAYDYRVGYLAQLRAIVGDVDRQHGIAKKQLIGGISFGGLHAMMGIVLCPDLFDAYFASLPVTRIAALKQLRGVDASMFNPFNDSQALAHHKGFISYGTADDRVNYKLTVQLLLKMNSTLLTKKEYLGLGHATTDLTVTDLANWVRLQ